MFTARYVGGWGEHNRLSEAGSDLQRLVPGGERAGLVHSREAPLPLTRDEIETLVL